ncbi:MAG: EF-hand domain-containing protein [Sneathiella sp.]|nr:EF-hand domain-containing protein [Sneathiella sp.]
MKKLLIAAAALSILAAAPALAATTDFKAVDTDGNGTVSYEELLVVMPDVTKGQFATADADGSGELSVEEFEKVTMMK